jgi:hypothetical protein
MAGSFVIALLSAAAARKLLPTITRRVLSYAETLYETILIRLHLPPTFFPRHNKQH